MTHSRRIFITRSLAGGCAFVLPLTAGAATHVEEADPTAVALGFRLDTHQADAAKYPKHTAQQSCVACSFWQGAATDEWAGCAMFGRKQVPAGGWCSAFAKK